MAVRKALHGWRASARGACRWTAWFSVVVLLTPHAAHAGIVPPQLKSCEHAIDDSDDAVSELVTIAADGTASLATNKGDERLDTPMDLAADLVVRDNRRRLLNPAHASPLLGINILAPANMPARAISDWIFAALGELRSAEVRQRTRLMMLGVRGSGPPTSEKDICASRLSLTDLRRATGSWAQLSSSLPSTGKGTFTAEDARESGAKALKWYTRNCSRGQARDCESAGSLLLEHDVIRDSKAAEPLLQRGCDLGSTTACRELSEELFKATELYRAKAYPRALALLRKACDAGDIEGCTDLGDKLIYGAGIKPDLDAALRILKSACDRKNDRACMLLKAPEFHAQ